MKGLKRRRARQALFATVTATALAWLVCAQAAQATQSTIYEHFAKCPTGAAVMNDTNKASAVCASSLVRAGLPTPCARER